MVVMTRRHITLTVMIGETKVKNNFITIDAIMGKTISLKLAKTEMSHLIKGRKKMNLESEMKIETTILTRIRIIFSTAGETSEKPKSAMEIRNHAKTLVMHISNVNSGKDFKGKITQTTTI